MTGQTVISKLILTLVTASFLIYASDSFSTQNNDLLLLDTLESIVFSSSVANCDLIFFRNTTNGTFIDSEELVSFGRRIGKPIILLNNTFCIGKYYKHCSLNKILVPKSTCFTFLIFLSPVPKAPVNSVKKAIISLLRPSNVKKGHYIFFTLGDAYSKPKFLSDSSLDFFQNKIEVTQAVNKKGEIRRLLYTYDSLNTKSFILLGVYSNKTGLTLYGESLFPDLTRMPHTKEFKFSLVHPKLQETLSSNKALTQFYDLNPLKYFIDNLVEAYNWTLSDHEYYESMTLYRGGFIDRLYDLKIAIGVNFIVDRISLYFAEISPAYYHVSMCYLEKKELKVITTWDSLAHVLRTTYPGYSYLIITGAIGFHVAVTAQLGFWIITSGGRRKKIWERLKSFFTDFYKTFGLLHNIAFLQHNMIQITRRRLKSIKVVLITWWLVSIWSAWNMRTTLTSLTTSPDERTHVQQDFIELLTKEKSSGIYGGVHLDKEIVRPLFRAYGDKYAKVVNRLEYMPDPIKCMNKVLSSSRYYACIQFQDILEAVVQMLPREERSKLVMKPMTFFHSSFNLFLAFPKNFPYAEKIGQRMSWAVESGLTQYWHQKANEALKIEPKSAVSSDSQNTGETLSDDPWSHQQRIVVFIMGLYSVAILAFLIELSVSKSSRVVDYIQKRCSNVARRIQQKQKISDENYDAGIFGLQDFKAESYTLRKYCIDHVD